MTNLSALPFDIRILYPPNNNNNNDDEIIYLKAISINERERERGEKTFRFRVNFLIAFDRTDRKM